MQLTILGMNGPFPAAGGATSGYLVQNGDTRLQLDLGCGTLARLTALTAPEGLTALIFSHWHFDHCSDVLPLIFRMEALAVSGAAPLQVYGPADEASIVRKAVQQCTAMELHDLQPGDEITVGDAQMRVFAARHPVPAVMLRISMDGKTLCYTGDTNDVDGLREFADSADLLLADGLFPTGVWAAGKPHLSAAMAAQLAKDAGAKQLVVTHLNPTIDPVGLLAEAREIRIDARLAASGDVYTL